MSNEVRDAAQKSSWPILKRLLGYTVGRRKGLAIAAIGMAGYAAVDTYMISLIKPLLDDGLSGKDPSAMLWLPFMIMGLVALRGVCNFTSDYFMAWVGNTVVMRLQRTVFSHLMGMPLSFFDKHNTGTLLSKVTYDASQVSSAASSTLISLIREGCTVIGLLVLMFYYSWQLSVIFFVIGPIVAFLISVISKRFRKLSKQLQHAMGNITTSTEQMLRGHKEVLMFGGQEIEASRFDKVSNAVRQQNMKMVVADAVGSPIVQFIASTALALVLYLATYPEISQQLTAGSFAAVISALFGLMKPLKSLTQVNVQFQKGIAACQSLFDVIDLPLEEDNGQLELKQAAGKIEFRNVTFTYPTKDVPALREVNFTIEPGKTIALVGRSGSGKSTIASLLTRFYDIQEGKILLDGHDIRDYRLRDLRRQFALVSQNVHLFNDTVANNIAYAAEENFTREQIIQAAKLANADEFIVKMPQGYDTVIGENGATLSGGQRQRLAIARALLRDMPVLLLDEATSALDTESERRIQAALESLTKNRTTLVIAHRLSTIENADEILVVDDGQIVERGTHEQLLKIGGAYALLRRTQMGAQTA
ncbi:lipid A ABC exporter, fused ATPase and inner membrane subunits MsbA [Tolumonas auensis DSM 9187]|uniref:Lipid A ABC exporter, fused ATPase and inner membrane subunits MsbA n=1 Tax=Tolumonas auensis (strain DSM 9187 / NBRC 110442 / TA 4) TaxID=595494 RepID=C4L8W3_TOLAT|nr:lipid A ABC transporter ATP-binding protein/permease MsbA [Tolumonas auensis]ACQ93833.1 lipid A ABC exporter, fused ATPase and inner membrane subunits MsbA [Tolumonas auensis DSM 9187]NCB56261.1 lipid A ABC transporter ATP-binding protein/permease MsbA [Gammaproteobacteria bacterium]